MAEETEVSGAAQVVPKPKAERKARDAFVRIAARMIVAVSRIGRTVTVTLDKLSPDTLDYVVDYGLKQILADFVANWSAYKNPVRPKLVKLPAKLHARFGKSHTFGKRGNEAKDETIRDAGVTECLRRLYAGEVSKSSGASRDTFLSFARRIVGAKLVDTATEAEFKKWCKHHGADAAAALKAGRQAADTIKTARKQVSRPVVLRKDAGRKAKARKGRKARKQARGAAAAQVAARALEADD